jgi:hypothetical protein
MPSYAPGSGLILDQIVATVTRVNTTQWKANFGDGTTAGVFPSLRQAQAVIERSISPNAAPLPWQLLPREDVTEVWFVGSYKSASSITFTTAGSATSKTFAFPDAWTFNSSIGYYVLTDPIFAVANLVPGCRLTMNNYAQGPFAPFSFAFGAGPDHVNLQPFNVSPVTFDAAGLTLTNSEPATALVCAVSNGKGFLMIEVAP